MDRGIGSLRALEDHFSVESGSVAKFAKFATVMLANGQLLPSVWSLLIISVFIADVEIILLIVKLFI